MCCKHKPQNAAILHFDEKNYSIRSRFLFRFGGRDDFCRACAKPIRVKHRWLLIVLAQVLPVSALVIVFLKAPADMKTLAAILKLTYLLAVGVFFWRGGLLFRWEEDTSAHTRKPSEIQIESDDRIREEFPSQKLR